MPGPSCHGSIWSAGTLVQQARAYWLKVVPLTLNTDADIRAAAGFGVDGFGTDDSCRVEEILKRIV